MGIMNYIKNKFVQEHHGKEDVIVQLAELEVELANRITETKDYKSICLDAANELYQFGLERETLSMCMQAAEMDEYIDFDKKRCGLIKELRIKLDMPSKTDDVNMEEIYSSLKGIPIHNKHQLSNTHECLQMWTPSQKYINKASYCYFAFIAIKAKDEKKTEKETNKAYCTLPDLEPLVEA